MKTTSLAFLLLLFLFLSCQQEKSASKQEAELSPPDSIATFTRIAFGSCNRQDKPQPLWVDILQTSPALWVWLGDNIYGDTDEMEVLQAKYAEQNAQPDYQKLKNTVPMIATWDDHDYGTNDGGKNYAYRRESQALFHDFIGTPQESPLRQQEGIYHHYDLKTESGKTLRFILLDTRYFKDDIVRTSAGYQPNAEALLLGEKQWAWLSETYKNSPADLHIVCTSIQLLPEEHKYEKWANFPTARQRFLDSLKVWQDKPTLLLSGDRHLAEISQQVVEGLNFPLYEITSSGMTHAGTISEEPNQYRVGKLVYGKLNFGILDVYEEESGLRVHAQIRGEGNQVLEEIEINYEN